MTAALSTSKARHANPIIRVPGKAQVGFNYSPSEKFNFFKVKKIEKEEEHSKLQVANGLVP